MKNTNEIIEKIKTKYAHLMVNRDINKKLSEDEEKLHHHKQSKVFEEFAEQDQARMNELSDLYVFITGKDWCDSIRELHEYAKGIRG